MYGRMFGLTLGLAVGLALTAACEGWPRWSEPLTPGGDVPVGTDPRTLVTLDWSEGTLSNPVEPDNDSPSGTQRREVLQIGAGRLFFGELTGVGERCGVPDRVVVWEDDTCPEASFGRYAGEEGCDYTFDADVFIVETLQAGHLCVGGWLGASPPSHRIDVITFTLPEACDVPTGFASDDEGDAYGFGVYADRVEYGFPAEAGGRYAILVAGWAEHDRDAVVPYNVGVSLMPAAVEGGGQVLCPLLPEFVAPEGGGQ